MPGHGGHGHGGGGHGGGHHGGGGHHHGGGGRPGGWQGGWGPGWIGPGVWYNDAQPAYTELVVAGCPDVVDPVLGSDGRRYLNACAANQAGVTVVQKLGKQTAISGLPDLSVPKNLVLIALAVGVGYVLLHKTPRERSAARVRTRIRRR